MDFPIMPAVKRMINRSISRQEVETVISEWEIIE